MVNIINILILITHPDLKLILCATSTFNLKSLKKNATKRKISSNSRLIASFCQFKTQLRTTQQEDPTFATTLVSSRILL